MWRPLSRSERGSPVRPRSAPAARLWLVCGLLAALCGCANPGHLFFYQTTVIGIDVAVSPQTNNVKASLGYDRQTNAIIPATQDAAGDTEAMSVVGTTYVTAEWLGTQTIRENVATGTAAENVAQTALGIKTLFQPVEEAKKR